MAAVRLTSTDLRALASKLEALEAGGLDVTEMRHNSLRVALESTDDQREGRTYYVTAVTPWDVGHHESVCRST